MKTWLLSIILLPCLWFAMAEGTNEVFVFDDGILPLSREALFTNAHYAGLVQEASKTRESLPAKDFPEGNWGPVQAGFQLSLRLAKQFYTNGEAVTAILLVRNVTNDFLTYNGRFWQRLDGPIGFSLTTARGEPIPEKLGPGPLGGGNVTLPPRMQHKFVEHLNSGYDLTNGSYMVHALMKVAGGDLVGGRPHIEWYEVRSAGVTLEIQEQARSR